MDCSRHLFDDLKEEVEIELEDKHLPKFLTTDSFLNHTSSMIKKDPHFLEALGTPRTPTDFMSERTVDNTDTETEVENDTEVIYNKKGFLYDFSDVNITDDDFERLFVDVVNRDMWKPVYTSDKRTVSVSKSEFYNGKKGLKKMFETGVVPYSVDEVFNAYVDAEYLQVVEKEISSQTQVDYVVSGKYAMSVVNMKYKLKFPMQNRDLSLILSTRRENNGAITFLRKSIVHSRIPKNKGFIRAFAAGGIIFEKVGEGLTRYSQSYYVDYGGWITSALFNKLMEYRDNAWHDALNYACLERRMRSLGRPTSSWSVVQTLEHNEREQNYKPNK
jgi:hypothetical protein